jgi:hypothetical protein
MNKHVIIFYIAVFILAVTIGLSCGGCIGGTGLEKQCTLVPDSVGVTWGQQRFREESAAYRGFMVHATWNLK